LSKAHKNVLEASPQRPFRIAPCQLRKKNGDWVWIAIEAFAFTNGTTDEIEFFCAKNRIVDEDDAVKQREDTVDANEDERQSESAALLRSIGRRVAGEMGAGSVGNRSSGAYAFTSPRSESIASKRSESSLDGASTSSRDGVGVGGEEGGGGGGGGGVVTSQAGAGRSGAGQRWRRLAPGQNGGSRTETDMELRGFLYGSPNRNGNRQHPAHDVPMGNSGNNGLAGHRGNGISIPPAASPTVDSEFDGNGSRLLDNGAGGVITEQINISDLEQETNMAFLMQILEADAGLGGAVDAADFPWPWSA